MCWNVSGTSEAQGCRRPEAGERAPVCVCVVRSRQLWQRAATAQRHGSGQPHGAEAVLEKIRIWGLGAELAKNGHLHEDDPPCA